jgi:hypothetical protein
MPGDFKGLAYRRNSMGHHKLTEKEQLKNYRNLEENWLSAVHGEYYKRRKKY